VPDGLTIPGDDNVTLVHSRLGSWSLRLDVHYHYTSSAALDCDKPEAETEITPRDVPVFLKSGCDSLNSSRRDHEDSPARSEHCHANCPACRVNCEATFRALSHPQIKFDSSIDLTPTQRPPWTGTARHHPKSCGWRAIFSSHR